MSLAVFLDSWTGLNGEIFMKFGMSLQTLKLVKGLCCNEGFLTEAVDMRFNALHISGRLKADLFVAEFFTSVSFKYYGPGPIGFYFDEHVPSLVMLKIYCTNTCTHSLIPLALNDHSRYFP